MSNVFLEMKNIHKRFLGVYALKGVQLEIKKGEVHALLGENGAKVLKEKGITKGKIALAAVNLTQTTMTYRQEGIKAGFEKVMGADAKNFEWLEPIQDNDQSAESKRQLEAQITSNPNMVAVFSLGSEGPDTGVMEAIKSQGKSGSIYHFGFDYTPTWENGISNNLISGIVDQDYYAIGKTIIDVLDKKSKSNLQLKQNKKDKECII